jgi:hypothetical protein
MTSLESTWPGTGDGGSAICRRLAGKATNVVVRELEELT